MPYFAYRGRNARGELVTGVLEERDEGAVADQLLSSGIAAVDIAHTAAPSAARHDSWLARMTAPPITLDDKLLFSRQMYTLLKSGVPIMRALAGLQESAKSVTMARVMQDLRASLDSGRDLNSSMRRHPEVFSQFFVNMVRVGEMSGSLEEIFLRLFNHLEFEKDMKERVQQALRYPAFVLAAMGIAIVIINLLVIPAFAKLFAGLKSELPLITQILIQFSNFMVQYWPLLFGLAVAAVLGFRVYTGTQSGRYNWDRFKLRLPLAGSIVEKVTLARFARSFAISVKSGMSMVQTLAVLAQVVDNAYIAQRIDQMREGVERGESLLRTARTTGVFTPIVLQMLAVGEEAGAVDDLMSEVADMYQREIDYELKGLSANIEPVMITFLGILVLILALGVFLPIWDLGSAALGPKGG
ncbi:MAG: type II secretion system F family protein [Burkholderiales bacterium]|nr:type II secretion system F family protein [Burkholderiales bacterium]